MLITPWTRFGGDGLHGRYPLVTQVRVDLGTWLAWPETAPRHFAPQGLDVSGTVRGQLHGRLQDVHGRWYGVCNLDLSFADGRTTTIRLTDQVVPFHSLRVAEERERQRE